MIFENFNILKIIKIQNVHAIIVFTQLLFSLSPVNNAITGDMLYFG